jgi:hypothetical protein
MPWKAIASKNAFIPNPAITSCWRLELPMQLEKLSSFKCMISYEHQAEIIDPAEPVLFVPGVSKFLSSLRWLAKMLCVLAI